jgi:hypothetical protein
MGIHPAVVVAQLLATHYTHLILTQCVVRSDAQGLDQPGLLEFDMWDPGSAVEPVSAHGSVLIPDAVPEEVWMCATEHVA